jgi:hypothetical protein
MSQEIVAAQHVIARFTRWQGREPVSVAADATYGNGESWKFKGSFEMTNTPVRF